MPNPTDAADAPADAVATVLARLEANDETVTARDLLVAESAERFDAARAEAARRKAAADAERDRLDRIGALRERIPTDLDPGRIDAARAALAEALDAWTEVCLRYDRDFNEAWEELADPRLGPLPRDVSAEGVSSRYLTVGGRTFHPSPAVLAIKREAAAAIGRRVPRRMADFGRPEN